MPSKSASDLLDLAAGIPTTPADVEALAAARDLPAMSMDRYIDWITSMSDGRPASREIRTGETFDLFRRRTPNAETRRQIDLTLAMIEAAFNRQ